MVALAISTKKRWRLPPCIPYHSIIASLETVVDGSWGCLSGSASVSYLIQRYEFRGQARVSICLFSSNTSMNSLTKLGHQVDAELGAFSCAVIDVKKSIRTLKDMNVKLEGGPTVISDSQTCLSLCLCPSSTLDLSTSLTVSRVQEIFTYSNLHFVPGKTFEEGLDLLKRYPPPLLKLITNKFYSPSWLKPENKDRNTVKVTEMKKAENLPHLNENFHLWARMKGSNSLGENLLQEKPSSDQPPRGVQVPGDFQGKKNVSL